MNQLSTPTSASTARPARVAADGSTALRTSLLPPAPLRHHWCVVLPPSHLERFDQAGPDTDLHRELVEALWARGVGCARFDLGPVTASSAAARFDRRRDRAAEVLERLARIDAQASVTLLGWGDAVDVALALAEHPDRSWPDVRGLLLTPPPAGPADRSGPDPRSLARQARDLAATVARDERSTPRRRPEGVTRRLLRRLGR